MLKRILKLIEGDFERDKEFMEDEEIKEYTECIEWIKKEIGNAITLSMIESVNVISLAKNLHIYTGKLNDGTYFMGGDEYFDLMIVDSDPDTAEGAWEEEWITAHLIRKIADDYSYEPFLNILTWCKINLPAEHEFHKEVDDVYLELRQAMFPI